MMPIIPAAMISGIARGGPGRATEANYPGSYDDLAKHNNNQV